MKPRGCSLPKRVYGRAQPEPRCAGPIIPLEIPFRNLE